MEVILCQAKCNKSHQISNFNGSILIFWYLKGTKKEQAWHKNIKNV